MSNPEVHDVKTLNQNRKKPLLKEHVLKVVLSTWVNLWNLKPNNYAQYCFFDKISLILKSG
jgi:hypothetical protein